MDVDPNLPQQFETRPPTTRPERASKPAEVSANAAGDVYARLGTSPDGLTAAQAQARLDFDQPGYLTRRRPGV